MKKLRWLPVVLVLGSMTISFSSNATKWAFRSLYEEGGQWYAVEECERRFLSTDGCIVGSQRMIAIPDPGPQIIQ